MKPEFVAQLIATEEGIVHQGIVVREDADTLVLREVASCEVVSLAKSDIAERREIGTLMPEGLAAAMSSRERSDLVRFLLDLGSANTADLEGLLGHSHEAAQFTYTAAPLEPASWRYVNHRVNRDRLYDFYQKEADYFRDLGQQMVLMPAYPGLDGGRLGHWGNQNEETSRATIDGSAWTAGRSSVAFFRTGRNCCRAVCARLGGADELAVCFNTETLTYAAAWQGGFVNHSPIRYGFVDRWPPPAIPSPSMAENRRGSNSSIAVIIATAVASFSLTT